VEGNFPETETDMVFEKPPLSKYVMVAEPDDTPVTERVLPSIPTVATAVFSERAPYAPTPLVRVQKPVWPTERLRLTGFTRRPTYTLPTQTDMVLQSPPLSKYVTVVVPSDTPMTVRVLPLKYVVATLVFSERAPYTSVPPVRVQKPVWPTKKLRLLGLTARSPEPESEPPTEIAIVPQSPPLSKYVTVADPDDTPVTEMVLPFKPIVAIPVFSERAP
jgi:hypothetical protein